MENYLLKSTDSRDSVGHSARSSQLPFSIRIPQTYLKHVIAFFPNSIRKVEGIEYLAVGSVTNIGIAVSNSPLRFDIEDRPLA
jgi:hypothetical protein